LVFLDSFGTDRSGNLGWITYLRVGGSGGDDALRLAGCESYASDEANHHQRYEDTLFLSHKDTINYVFHFVLVLC
jgi:hypothetical protein